MPDRPATYSRNQLIAHWLIVLLVAMQFLQNGAMEEAFGSAVQSGAFPLSGGAWMHGLGGSTILLIMLWRLTMRLRHGTPPPPESEPPRIRQISRGTHWAFYGVLIAMPLIGLLAVLTLQGFLGVVHGLLSWVLLILIVMHIGGAIWHMVRGDSAVWHRMLSRDPADEAKTP